MGVFFGLLVGTIELLNMVYITYRTGPNKTVRCLLYPVHNMTLITISILAYSPVLNKGTIHH